MSAPPPSRLREVLRPAALGAVFLATLGAASLALDYDSPRAKYTIGVVVVVLVFASCVAIGPYLASIGRGGFDRDFPILGVRTAFLGCAGFTALLAIAFALPRPLEPALAAVALVAAAALPTAARIRARRS